MEDKGLAPLLVDSQFVSVCKTSASLSGLLDYLKINTLRKLDRGAEGIVH